MKKETKSELYTLISESELYTLISKYEKRLSQEKKQEELAKAQGAASASEFIKIRDKIIVPMMEEVSNKLQEHGHNISILEEDDWIDELARKKEESITMQIILAGKIPKGRYDNKSRITFSILKGGSRIDVYNYVSSPRSESGGETSSIDIKRINRFKVAKKIMKFLNDVFEQNC